MKKIIKYSIAGVIAVIVIGSAAYGATRPLAAEIYTVKPGTAELYFTEVGEVIAGKSVSVYSFSEGKLLSVDVAEGQYVNEGDAICRIDPSEYSNMVAQLEAGISGYHTQAGGQSRVQTLSVTQSEKNAQSEKENFDRMKELYSNGAISKSELDAAKLRADNAANNLQQSKEQLALIKSGGEGEAGAKVNRLKIDQLRQNIDDCVIKAPISGVITNLAADDTNLITNQMLVATIESEENTQIEVMVNTSDIDNVRKGDSVELSLRRRDGDKTLGGIVSEIDGNAEVKVSAKGNEERLVKITITPDQKDAFKIGYDVDVKFSYYKEENQLTVPKSAVFEEDGKSFVWAIEEGRLTKREIQIKKVLRSEISAAEGILAGDTIIIDAGADGLKEGKRVK